MTHTYGTTHSDALKLWTCSNAAFTLGAHYGWEYSLETSFKKHGRFWHPDRWLYESDKGMAKEAFSIVGSAHAHIKNKDNGCGGMEALRGPSHKEDIHKAPFHNQDEARAWLRVITKHTDDDMYNLFLKSVHLSDHHEVAGDVIHEAITLISPESYHHYVPVSVAQKAADFIGAVFGINDVSAKAFEEYHGTDADFHRGYLLGLAEALKAWI